MKKSWLLLAPILAFGNPQGEKTRVGDCQFDRADHALTVTQSSDRAIIDWQSFSIDLKEATQINQPSSTSAILNRVVGNNLSEIHGCLSSNGMVYLINQNGILVGPNGKVKTGGFLASTLNIANGEFLEAGEMKFSGDSDSSLTLQGELWSPKGNIFLISKRVEHSGNILAPEGVVYGLAGSEIIIKPEGEMKLIRISGKGTLDSSGLIEAVQSELRSAGGEVDTLAINYSGIIHANGFEEREGRIILQSVGSGEIIVTGEMVAKTEKLGGTVHILGEFIQLSDEANIDVSGEFGGGTALIGGDYKGENPEIPNSKAIFVGSDVLVKADSIQDGDGGKLIFWGDETNWFCGNSSVRGGLKSGDGGFVEVSAKYLNFRGLVDRRAPSGEAGVLLLDPINVTVTAAADSANIMNPGGAGTYTYTACAPTPANILNTGAGSLETNLGLGSVIIDTSAAGGAGCGDAGTVTISAPVTWSANTLTINSDSHTTFTSGGDLTLNAPSAALTVNSSGNFTISAGSVMTINGSGNVNINATGSITISTAFGSGGAIIGSGTSSGNLTLSSNLGTRLIGHSTTTNILHFGAAGNTGNINIQCNLAANPGNFDGFTITDGHIFSRDGDITITAVGGTGAGNHGILFAKGIQSGTQNIAANGTGNITLTGTASVGRGISFDRSNLGVSTYNIATASGNISITGTSSASTAIGYRSGQIVNNITAGGSGVLTMIGTSTAASGWGIDTTNADIPSTWTANGANMTLTGTGPAGGIRNTATLITNSGTGNITMTGTGTTGDGITFTSTGDVTVSNGTLTMTGMGVNGASIVSPLAGVLWQATGTENVIINGTGTAGSGILLIGGPVQATIESVRGSVSMTGVGTGIGNAGIRGTTAPSTGVHRIRAGGNLTLMGTGTSGAWGINLDDLRARTTAAGTTNVTAIADPGTTALVIDGTTSVPIIVGIGGAASTGNTTINADTIDIIGVAATISTSGILTFQPTSAITSIGVGDNGVGTLNLDNAELGVIGTEAIPSEVQFGQATGAHTVSVDAGAAPPTLTSAYRFRGNGVSVDNFDVGANGLAFDIGQAGAGIANIGNTITSGTITVTGIGSTDTNTLQTQDIVNTWNVTSDNAGNINGVGVIDFTGEGNLVGGTSDDTFIFADGVGTSGIVDGGGSPITNTLDYTNFTTPAIVQFLGPFDGLASNIAGGFFNICCIIGNTTLPPVPNIPITFQNQVEVELAFNYLFLNGKNDDFYTLWQFFLFTHVIGYPNALWSNIAGAVLYQTLSSGLNRLEKWELEQEGVPPVVRAQYPHFVQ